MMETKGSANSNALKGLFTILHCWRSFYFQAVGYTLYRTANGLGLVWFRSEQQNCRGSGCVKTSVIAQLRSQQVEKSWGRGVPGCTCGRPGREERWSERCCRGAAPAGGERWPWCHFPRSWCHCRSGQVCRKEIRDVGMSRNAKVQFSCLKWLPGVNVTVSWSGRLPENLCTCQWVQVSTMRKWKIKAILWSYPLHKHSSTKLPLL